MYTTKGTSTLQKKQKSCHDILSSHILSYLFYVIHGNHLYFRNYFCYKDMYLNSNQIFSYWKCYVTLRLTLRKAEEAQGLVKFCWWDH